MKSAKKALKRSGINTANNKKPLKKKSLTTNSSLKSNISKPKPRKKLEEKTARELTKVADQEYSRYIRLRDSHGGETRTGTCITCGRHLTVYSNGKWGEGQNGHFITRGFMVTRFDDMNCHLQCAHCNAWRDKYDMTQAYAKEVEKRYGKGTVAELIELSKQPASQKLLLKVDLLDIIYTCRAYVKKVLT